MKVVVTAGGTGGHIFPALSLVIALRKADASIVFEWIGTSRSREIELCRENAIPITVLAVQGIVRSLALKNIGALFNFAMTALFMRKKFLKDRPDCVVAFGGYVCAPVLWAATSLKIPCYIHEQNAAMGLVNRRFVKKVRALFLGIPLVDGTPRGVDAMVVGTPIRPVSRHYEKFNYPEGFDVSKKGILICGGSQGAASMNDALVGAVRKFLAAGHQVIWQTGAVSLSKLKCLFSGTKNVFLFESMADMYPYYKVAKLSICRAGASTLSEVAYFGLPCVAIPLPWSAENHQWHNAGFAETCGFGIRVAQDQHCADHVEKVVTRILTEQGLYKEMCEKALAASPETAAMVMAQRIISESAR